MQAFFYNVTVAWSQLAVCFAQNIVWENFMLLQAQHSALVVIDMQNRLAPVISNFAEVELQCGWLIDVAHELNIPVLATEQYPQGLGVTIPSLLNRLKTDQIIEKIHFNACEQAEFIAALLDHQTKQVVLVGTEAHVCVLQTAFGLMARGLNVYLVAEAVGSRREADKQLALARFQQAGGVVVSREMVAFEWLNRAGTEQFRQISRGWLK
jgi:nicotinamidase-related amidase